MQNHLLQVHLIKDFCRDPTGTGKCMHHYDDITTFDNFIDCQGHKYDADMKGVCTLCCMIVQFKPKLDTERRASDPYIACPHHCDPAGTYFVFKPKT